MEDGMPTAQNTSAVGTQLDAPKTQSQIERFSMELSKQADLLSMLESRLDMISERSPQKPSDDAATDRPHISTLINQLARNNRRLNQLIQEIAL